MVINKEKEILELWKNELDYRRRACMHHMYTGLIFAGGIIVFLIRTFERQTQFILSIGAIAILLLLNRGTNSFSHLMDMWNKLIIAVHENKILDYNMDKISWVGKHIYYRHKYSK